MKLDKKTLDRILGAYGIIPLAYSKTTKGLVNFNWVVDAGKAKYVLRVSRFKNVKELESELDYLSYLKRHNFPYKVPVPVRKLEGGFTSKVCGLNAWVYGYIGGEVKARLGDAELNEIARMAGRYHALIEKSGFGTHSEEDLVRVKAIVRGLRKAELRALSRKKDSIDRAFLDNVGAMISMAKSIDLRTLSGFKRYPLHRDFGARNFLWKGSRLVGVLDFENIGSVQEVLLRDVASFFEYHCRKRRYEMDLVSAKLFLEEYSRYRRLSNAEIALIPDLMVLGYTEDFEFDYWRLRNDKKAKLSDMVLTSRSAAWCYANREMIKRNLSLN
jgi:Ser/Thr protein kinase RdoA (MazF antagonist)